MRVAIPQDHLIDDIAALHAAHGDKPIPPEAFTDIHATLIDQQTSAPHAEGRIAWSWLGNRCVFFIPREGHRGIHTALLG
jgi:hypothetical protein